MAAGISPNGFPYQEGEYDKFLAAKDKDEIYEMKERKPDPGEEEPGLFATFRVGNSDPTGKWRPPFMYMFELSNRQKTAICNLVDVHNLKGELPHIANLSLRRSRKMPFGMAKILKSCGMTKKAFCYKVNGDGTLFENADGKNELIDANSFVVTHQVDLSQKSIAKHPALQKVALKMNEFFGVKEEKKVRGKRKIDKVEDAANEAAKKNKGYVDEEGMIILPKGNTVHEVSAPKDATIVLSWFLPSGATSSVEFPAEKVFSIYVKNPTKESKVPESMLRLQ
jgi:hypothetical protein